MLCARYLFNGSIENTGEIPTNDNWSVQPEYDTGNIYEKSLLSGKMYWDEDTTEKILCNDAFTWMAWVYVDPNKLATKGQLFGNDDKTSGNNRKFAIYQSPSKNDISWYWMNDISNMSFSSGTLSNVLTSYAWTHVAFVYGNNKLLVYINGQLEYTQLNVTSNSSTFKYATTVIHNVRGRKLQDVRIYNEAVSESCIKDAALGISQWYKCNSKSTSGIIDTVSFTTDTPRYYKSVSLEANYTIKANFCPNRMNDICISFWVKFPSEASSNTYTFFKYGQEYSETKVINDYYNVGSDNLETYDKSDISWTHEIPSSEQVVKSNNVVTEKRYIRYNSSGITLDHLSNGYIVMYEGWGDNLEVGLGILDTSVWHQFVINLDENRNVSVYVDGNDPIIGKSKWEPKYNTISTTKPPTFTGPLLVSDVCIFGRHLSDDEAKDLYYNYISSNSDSSTESEEITEVLSVHIEDEPSS